MKRVFVIPLRRGALLTLAVALVGCASFDQASVVGEINREAAPFTGGALQLVRTAEQHAQSEAAVARMLEHDLSPDDAIRVAMLKSPSIQAVLAQGWNDGAQAAQASRLPNPRFTFEHLTVGNELEIGRLLSFGVLDLLLYPQRYGVALSRMEEVRQKIAADVVDQAGAVRRAWVDAVAARQVEELARRVVDSAAASAELARRMQAAGNFTRLQRMAHQSYYAEATARLATAQHERIAAREALVRLLGLNPQQAMSLRLPQRLPDLPTAPMAPALVTQKALDERIDVRLAQADLQASARTEGVALATSVTDIELGLRRDTVFDNEAATQARHQGYEIDVTLPLFDLGDQKRAAAGARTLAAEARLLAATRAANTSLRTAYSAYRTALDVARQYNDEILPLRRAMSDEQQLRYNGMLIGVFDLLADAREQAQVATAAINAQRVFWLSEADLQANIVGRPVGGALPKGAVAEARSDGPVH